MDATLVTVTVLSMTLAAALSAIVWRMLRLERQRSNARVASLAAAALRTEKAAAAVDAAGRGFRVVGQATAMGQAAAVGQGFRPDQGDLPLAPRSSSEGVPVPRSLGEGGMFVEREHQSPWGARVAVMTALALIIASVVLFSLAARAPRAASKTA